MNKLIIFPIKKYAKNNKNDAKIFRKIDWVKILFFLEVCLILSTNIYKNVNKIIKHLIPNWIKYKKIWIILIEDKLKFQLNKLKKNFNLLLYWKELRMKKK